MPFTVEFIERIWDDRTGESYEVGDDRDGIDITELRFRCDDGTIGSSFLLSDEALNFVLEALTIRHLHGEFEGYAPSPHGDDAIEIGEDRDGLGIAEFRYLSDLKSRKVEHAFTISNEVLPFVVAALERRVVRKRGKQDPKGRFSV